MDLLVGIERFVRVVEDGSFTHAARALQLTPGMISVSIANLESQLGAPLFLRTTRRLQLTEEGTSFYTECKKILEEIKETRSLFREKEKAIRPSGRIHIEASATTVHRLVMPIWPGFSRQYPDVELELNHTGQVFGVSDSGFDVMIRMGPFEDSDLVAKSLGYAYLWTAASPMYLARHGMPQEPDDLRKHACLNYVDPVSGRISPWSYEKDKVQMKMSLPGKISFNEDESRVSAALEGLGIIQTISYQLQDHVEEGRLKCLLPDWVIPAPQMNLLFHKNRFLTAGVRAFIDFMNDAYPVDREIVSIDRKSQDLI